MQKRNWIKILLFSLLAVVLVTVFHSFFLYQKEYKPLNISYTATANFDSFTWLAITPKYSDTLYRSKSNRLPAHVPIDISTSVEESRGIQFLGLYWNGSDQGTFVIENVSISSGNKKWKIEDLDKFITYSSANVSTETNKEQIIAKTNNKAYGWLMIEVLEFEKIARNKIYKPLGWTTTSILFVLFIFIGIFLKKKVCYNIKSLKVKGVKIYKLRIFLMYGWMVLLPFWIIISHVILAVSLALTIIHYIVRKEDFELRVLRKFIPIFLLFFIITAINTVFHSTEIVKDFADYSYFLLTPFLFLGIKKGEFIKVFSVFQLAIFTYCALLLIVIFERYLQLEFAYSFSQFFFETIEQYWHTSYLAGLIVIGLLYHIVFERKVTLLYIVLCVLGGAYLYLSQARLPLMVWLLIMMILVLSGVSKKRRKLWLSITVVVTIAVSGWLVSSENAREQLVTALLVNDEQKTDARPELWDAALLVFRDNAISGIGRNQIRQELANQLLPESAIKHRRYNAHNQYLEFLVAYGFTVPILLLLVLSIPVMFRFRATTIFVLYFAFAMLVESYFSRQSGVVIFSLFYCFFILYDAKSKKHIPTNSQ